MALCNSEDEFLDKTHNYTVQLRDPMQWYAVSNLCEHLVANQQFWRNTAMENAVRGTFVKLAVKSNFYEHLWRLFPDDPKFMNRQKC